MPPAHAANDVIDFRPYISVSDGFADWLDQMIDPLVEDRFASAREALMALTQPPASALARAKDRPLKLGTPLTPVAKTWLVHELDAFIKQLPQRPEVPS